VAVSIPVAVDALDRHIEERGSTAYLVTVRADERPHVVAVAVSRRGDTLVVGAGRTTTANVEHRPDVTLVWAAAPGSGYSLIVDGTAHPVDDGGEARLAIVAGRAVLHRTPEGDPSAPSCITVLPSSDPT
jgi:hypothetical protein